MEFHPAANLLPMMSDDELDELVEDIRQNGLQVPIELYEDKILDGRNRWMACQMAEVEPDFVDMTGEVEPYVYACSQNLKRRNLDKSQKALVAARFRDHFETEAKERMQAGGREGGKGVQNSSHPIDDTGKSRDKAGDALGVSGFSVDQASKVIKQGSKDLVNAVERGEVSVSAAAKLADKPKAEQSKVVRDGRASGNTKKAVVAATKPPVQNPEYPVSDGVKQLLTDVRSMLSMFRHEWKKPSDVFKQSGFDPKEREYVLDQFERIEISFTEISKGLRT